MEEDGWTVWLSVPPWAHRWKRLVIILDIVNTHALTGSLLTYLEQARELKALEALDLYKKLAGKDQIATRTQKTRSQFINVPKPMAKGRVLPRSKVTTFPIDPRSCPHNKEDMSGPRGTGGKFSPLKWVTCLKCGSRWERVWEDLAPPAVHPRAKPSTAMPSNNEEFVELFSEDETERQFVTVPKGRMVVVGSRTTHPVPPFPQPSLASTASAQDMQETPTHAMSVCHHATQQRILAGMTPQAAVQNVWESCTSAEEQSAMRAYVLANPTLQLELQ